MKPILNQDGTQKNPNISFKPSRTAMKLNLINKNEDCMQVIKTPLNLLTVGLVNMIAIREVQAGFAREKRILPYAGMFLQYMPEKARSRENGFMLVDLLGVLVFVGFLAAVGFLLSR